MAKVVTTKEAGKRQEKGLIWWAIATLAAAVLPYLLSLRGDFALDDLGLIVNDPLAHSLVYLPRTFGLDFLRGTLGEGVVYYRPLVTASYQANYMMAGPDPFVFRLTNLLLNAGVVALVFVFARRLTGSLKAGAIAAIAFAVLPSHAEAVAWVSGRTDVMSCLFGLGALIVFASEWDSESRFAWKKAVGCAALFLCALFSKENALAVPVLAVGYAWIRGGTVKRGDVVRWAATFVIPFAIYLAVRHNAVHVVVVNHMGVALGRRLLGVGIAYAAYMRMMFAPQTLRVIYDVFPIGMKYPAIALAAWMIPVGLVVTTVRLRKRAPALAFGFLWLFVTLLPVVNILPTSGPLPAERFVYMASFGSALVLGWLAKAMLEWKPDAIRVWPAVSVVIVAWYALFCGALTVQSCGPYQSDLAWSRAIAEAGGRFLRSWSAAHFLRSGMYREAAHEYQAAVTIGTDTGPSDYIGLATARRRLGEPEKAVEALLEARERFKPDARVELHLGMSFAEAGDLSDAADAFSRSTQLNPKSPDAWCLLGKALLKLGKQREGVLAYERALAIDPQSPKIRQELREARERLGK